MSDKIQTSDVEKERAKREANEALRKFLSPEIISLGYDKLPYKIADIAEVIYSASIIAKSGISAKKAAQNLNTLCIARDSEKKLQLTLKLLSMPKN